MRGIYSVVVGVFAIVALVLLQSCNNFSRDVKKVWDSGPIENFFHGGTFKGYAIVYTYDCIEGIIIGSSEETHRVYKRKSGEYVIDYLDETYVLKEMANPIGEEPFALKWMIDNDHYIMDVPHSY